MPTPFFRFDLRRLITWMCLFFVCLALSNGLYAAYKVQYELLLQHNMDTNRSYAERLSEVTNSFLQSAAQILEAAALDITDSQVSLTSTQKELAQLASLTDMFNAIMAVDTHGHVIASLPGTAFPVGMQLQAVQSWQVLQSKAISGAFKGPLDQWLSIMARPFFNPDNTVAGFVVGVLHLQGDSALQNALDKLHYQDGSYFLIVDERGQVVYHPHQKMIGDMLSMSTPVVSALQGYSGTQPIKETESEHKIVSYAPIQFAGWAAVTVRPIEVALSNMDTLILQTLYYSLPVFIISLLAIWWLARWIAKPLHELAVVAANLDSRPQFLRIRQIKTWYIEAALIRKGLMRSFYAISHQIKKLHHANTTDPLTNTANRRGLDAMISEMMATEQRVAVLMLDIDHFKQVNDTYGHALGDKVLQQLASILQNETRSGDVVARTGGEEFVILLPDTPRDDAYKVAEHLRTVVQTSHFEGVGSVTVSLGLACYPDQSTHIHDAMLLADAALYRAKAAGRNCSVIA